MRDLVFFLAFLVLLFFSFRRPFVAVSLWLWSGLFVPVYWLYGFASSISYNSIFAASTILGYFIYRHKPSFKANAPFIVVILFFLHTCLTSFFALAPKVVVSMELTDFFKAILLFVFICLILRKQHHFSLFLWVIVLSIGFMGFVEGLKFIASAGGHRIKGPSGNILSDNNHMAVAMCMTIPFIIYLISETQEKLLKFGLRFMLIMNILAVLGTFSRGGLIGLTIILGYFWLKSRHKMRSLFVLLFAAIIAYNLLPQSWYNRMATIDDAMDNSSFTTRVNSWKIHTLMALDRPLVGGGFKGPQVSYVWRALAVDIDKFDFIKTPPPGDKGWAAHSIYFQVLGDQGFLGLFWFLLFIFLTFVRLWVIERYYLRHDGKDSWQCRLAGMTKISILAYCVSGAALSLAYLEMFYAVLAMVVCLDQVRKASVVKDRKTVSNKSKMPAHKMNAHGYE
ncbi:putative O-glycosylation ligase, exosortase A system-associated [Vibrio nitrifigilis]|uniref:O-glycosylation ligase, exosortase A system-associated n=1 Tax=Vibrio nitrifigilis TaxID=2789781 RepID=A0ABS0GIC1_9VIBR|nr:putative O-glycosylation ligase, exosortase A system-associated [Vibrio nitrifigilis]MBF9002149.1 putative O-glycosylation ligase, exosortase A system-associated [Vibrio nitrifigilis]